MTKRKQCTDVENKLAVTSGERERQWKGRELGVTNHSLCVK